MHHFYLLSHLGCCGMILGSSRLLPLPYRNLYLIKKTKVFYADFLAQM